MPKKISMDLSPEEVALIEKRRAENPPWKPCPAEFISDANKVVAFDRLHNLAMENFNHAKEHGHEMKDIEHWCFEAVMDLLGLVEDGEPESIWKHYNELI